MPSLRRLFRVAIAFAIGAPAVPALAVAQSSSDTSFALPRNAVIDITLRTGRMVVRGTDRSTAELRSDGQRYELRSSGVGVTLAARDDRRDDDSNRDRRNRRDSRDANLELTVPRGVRLVISAGSAEVDVQDISGDVEVHALSGDVQLRSIGGRAIIETLSGDVLLAGGATGVRVTTMSGDIELRGVRGTAAVHTTSGDVTLDVERATQVDVETVSGEITVEGDLVDDAHVQLAAHSGDITLRIPESARGSMEVATYNGDLTSNRPLTLMAGTVGGRNRGERGMQRYEFGGGGAARLLISTFSGDIRFDRVTRRSPD
jgi:hypothetical protein